MNSAARLGLRVDELAGQVAVITGAGQGIGREAALALAGVGARIVVADINAETGAETARLIKDAGGTAIFVQTDVGREADVAKLAMWTLADFGPARILINNAILSPVASLLEMTPDQFDQVIAVNLRGAYLTCRAFLPGMLTGQQGTILNMVSLDAMANMSAYIASKQGLVGFSQSLAAELGHEGIRVIAFAPGFVETPGLLAAGEKLAPRMGLTPAEFGRLSLHPAYSGMMPAADAGLAAAYLAARLADEYAGEVVTGYTVLERAGLIAAPEAAAAAEVLTDEATAPAATLETLAANLARILAETEAEFGRLPIFVRPLARSGFKSKSGQSFADWRRAAQDLTAALQQNRPASPALPHLLERLITYYRGVPAETARFTKDPATLKAVTESSAHRVQIIEALITALKS